MAMKIKLAIILVIISLLLGGAFFYAIFTILSENPPLIGGCAGVYIGYWQECCDNWAEENNISVIRCVGNWTVENNQCKWQCQEF